MDIISLISGIVGVGVTLVGKKATQAVTSADSAIVKAIKPVQPLIAMGVGLLLPKACAAIHLMSCPDAGALVAAPVGTVIGISLLEILNRVKGKKA